MIIDLIHNAAHYYGLGERMATALRCLQDTDWAAMAPGRYDIDGDRIYVLVQAFPTRPPEQGVWEAHRRYIDIHCVLEGQERIGYANVESLESVHWDDPKDFWTMRGEGTFHVIEPGEFVVMLPQDAHMPGMAVGASQPLRKIVVKIAVE